MKKLGARRVSMIAAGLTVAAGCVYNMKRAYDTAVWWNTYCGHEASAAQYLRDTLRNFPGRWLLLDLDFTLIFPLALIYLIVQGVYGIIRRSSEKRNASPEKALKAERKISRVLFRLSFLPFALFIGWCFVSMFVGAEMFGGGKAYGIEAFGTSFVWVGLALCIIPVFPVMFVFQTVYIIRGISRKRRQA